MRTVKSTDPSALSYEEAFATTVRQVNEALEHYLSSDYFAELNGFGLFHGRDHRTVEGPTRLWESLRYSTLGGGKRIRPVLAIQVCLACGGRLEDVLPTACAIELVHAQSLIHDDLPCMDDDDLRRGQPTLHKAFEESTAVLAGDALLALAFGLVARETPQDGKVSAQALLQVIAEFSSVSSVQGLVNGQFVDIYYEGRSFGPDVLEYIHTYKTGALFTFSATAGARLAGAPTPLIEGLCAFGQKLGLAFQIVDDLLDIQSASEAMGKTVGKDLVQQKATYPAHFGVEASRSKVKELVEESEALLNRMQALYGQLDVRSLRILTDFICHRMH